MASTSGSSGFRGRIAARFITEMMLQTGSHTGQIKTTITVRNKRWKVTPSTKTHGSARMNKRVATCGEQEGTEGADLVTLHTNQICETVEDDEDEEFSHPIPWRKIEAEGLDCDHGLLFSTEEADRLFSRLEEEVEYFTGDQAKVQVYGKLHSVPRQQATYGDEGLMYSFSGVHLLARPWTPTLEYIRDAVTNATGQTFNFVLINRYKDGHDHIGEHRDDERELDPTCPIASVSLGAVRDFVFRHKDARVGPNKRQIEPVKLELAHGSLLLMNSPTNTYWYHSLPVRKKVKTPRINLTFRRIIRSRRRSDVKKQMTYYYFMKPSSSYQICSHVVDRVKHLLLKLF